MRRNKVWRNALLLGFLSLIFVSSSAQELIKYESNARALNESQTQYLKEILSWPMSMSYELATIDFEMLGRSTLQFRLKNGLVIDAVRADRDVISQGSRKAWVGDFPGAAGNAHLVYVKSKEHLIAHVQYEDVSFLIRPLGAGLHAIVEWDMTMDEGCLTNESNSEPSGVNKEDVIQGLERGTPDLVASITDESESAQRATGECSIRVLIAYTTPTANAVTDILSDIINMTNIANTGYVNSNINYSLELAMAYNITYTEHGSDIGIDRDRFRATSDGFMDDVHTQRILWDADQCMLLTSYGSGIAYISTDYADQFSVTGVPNFNAHTYQHEFGHCNECTHATNQLANSAGTAPYAGWGDPSTTSSCFRTVMAYKEACGTNSCPRHNIWSDNDPNSWSCGGSLYTPGTANARNQDRLVLSRPIINGHQTVGLTTSFSGDYDWFNNEAVHFAAEQTLAYSSSTNNFEFYSGSEGSFRASDHVTLGEGFRARPGSDFRAYLESCP